jgi:hypothetical protein
MVDLGDSGAGVSAVLTARAALPPIWALGARLSNKESGPFRAVRGPDLPLGVVAATQRDLARRYSSSDLERTESIGSQRD